MMTDLSDNTSTECTGGGARCVPAGGRGSGACCRSCAGACCSTCGWGRGTGHCARCWRRRPALRWCWPAGGGAPRSWPRCAPRRPPRRPTPRPACFCSRCWTRSPRRPPVAGCRGRRWRRSSVGWSWCTWGRRSGCGSPACAAAGRGARRWPGAAGGPASTRAARPPQTRARRTLSSTWAWAREGASPWCRCCRAPGCSTPGCTASGSHCTSCPRTPPRAPRRSPCAACAGRR